MGSLYIRYLINIYLSKAGAVQGFNQNETVEVKCLTYSILYFLFLQLLPQAIIRIEGEGCGK